MTLRKSIYLTIALGLIVGLVACSSSSVPPTVAISATGGTPQSATVATAYATQLQATVTSGGAPSNNVSVTFSAPTSGPSCLFANGNATESDNTSNGVATSSVCTANTTAGAFAVTASVAGATTSAQFALSNTAGSPVAIAVNSGSGQFALISTPFTSPLVANVVDTYSNPVPGASVTFTVAAGGGGATGVFGTSSTTDNETTDANGNATTSQVLTANGTTGSFTVSADFSGDTSGSPAVFTLNNAISNLSAGNYTFQVTGTDGEGLPYSMAGVFTLASPGTITAGEFDFTDYNYQVSAEQMSAGGTVLTNTAGNQVISLITGDTYINYGGGTVTLEAALPSLSATTGTLAEVDGWASGSGDLNLQTSTTFCASVPCSYAFFGSGTDINQAPAAYGGIITVDGAGVVSTNTSTWGISGNSSIWDINDGNNPTPGNAFTASTVTSPSPNPFGMVTFSLFTSQSATVPAFVIDGYMIDANHLRLVENWSGDDFGGVTSGAATAQIGAGGFSGASVAGITYVFGVAGSDANGPLQSAGVIGFDSADSNITGNVSWNDIAGQAPQGGTTLAAATGTYAVDAGGLGDVTVTNITDSTTSPTLAYNFQMYLTGYGDAYVISMDSTDVQAGRSAQQANGLSASSFSGNYAVGLGQYIPSVPFEQDLTGLITADGVGTFSGSVDVNVAALIPADDLPITGTFAVSSTNGLWTGTIADPVVSGQMDSVTYYVIDPTQGVVIENDNTQLTLGYYTSN